MRNNNRLENLRWSTSADNHHDRIAHGTALTGESGPSAKLTAAEVRRIREAAGLKTQAVLAAEFGVGQPHISSILRGETWR